MTLPVEQVEHHLAETLNNLPPGEEIVLTRDDRPIAILRALNHYSPPKRQLGTQKGTVLSIAPDFDAIPEGFEDYLP